MKKTYNQPEVQVTEIQCVTVIAASAPIGESFNIMTETTTDTQW